MCQMNVSSPLSMRLGAAISSVWPPVFLAVCCLALAAFSPFLWLSLLALAAFGLLCLDTMARYRDYLTLRRAMRQARGLTGPARALFRRARSSWCTRRAALAAAYSEGFGAEARALVGKWGYKPWHVFPDGAFSRRSPFLRFAFWRSVLGL